jgi:hypothetical protein
MEAQARLEAGRQGIGAEFDLSFPGEMRPDLNH